MNLQNDVQGELDISEILKISVGAFVTSGVNDYGIGRFLGFEEDNAIVQYFDFPGENGLHEITVPAISIQTAKVSPSQRVYVHFKKFDTWQVGNVVWFQRAQALVHCADTTEWKVPASSLYIRWNKPAKDPTAFLSNRINETAIYAYARRRFLSLISQQQVAAEGMQCLLSSAVDLEHHQVEVVRRVLRDPIQRYLLGDEVGLGKTIEAGFIMRQHMSDNPEANRILLVVPESLERQWIYELDRRFGLMPMLGEKILVVTLVGLPNLKESFKPTMVVIDEAHHAAALYRDSMVNQVLFEKLRSLAISARALLLLTATPLLHNERDYLTMLHLLDPEIYQLDDLEGFRDRVKKRQSIAEACFVLKSETPNTFLSDAAAQISEQMPNDEFIRRWSAKLRSRLDADCDFNDAERNEAIYRLRTHLSEVYKLHRRLLRNRRVGELKALTPGRAGLTKVEYLDPDAMELFKALECWRQCAIWEWGRAREEKKQAIKDRFSKLLSYCLDLGRSRDSSFGYTEAENGIDPSCVDEIFDGEQAFLRSLADASAQMQKSIFRLDALFNFINSRTNEVRSWVIFCSALGVADRVCAFLANKFGHQVVFRHEVKSSEWLKFHRSKSLAILVCDEQAEHGLNLQGHEALLVHFDLPLSPGRIEQRMGRLDRFCRGNPVRSAVLSAQGNSWEEEWCRFFDEGLNVFGESIASLQYATAIWFEQGLVGCLKEGAGAWGRLSLQIGGAKGEAARERKAIDEQDAIDQMDLPQAEVDSFVDRLRAVESDQKIQKFSDSLKTWARCALHIKVHHEGHDSSGVFRLVFEDGTLIPEPTFEKYFGKVVEEDCLFSHWGDMREVKASARMCFGRRLAQARGCMVARYGETFLDSLADYTRSAERGTSYAFWRCKKTMPKQYEGAYIRLDFQIDADDAQAEALCNGAADIRAIRREADALFPPMHCGLWLNSDHEHVKDQEILKLLEAPLISGRFGEDGDFDLTPSRWASLGRHSYFKDWKLRLQRSYEEAIAIVSGHPSIQDHVARSRASAGDILSNFERQMVSRLSVLPAHAREVEQRQFERELRWRKALHVGLTRPRIVFDSIGMAVLSRKSI